MRKGVGFGLLVILVVIIGIGIIDAGAKRPVNWTKTYNFRDKNPYGLFVFRNEVANILGDTRSFSDFGTTLYELLDSATISESRNMAIVDIYDYSYFDDLDVKSLMDFVNVGGEAFIAANEIGTVLLDSLRIKTEALNYSKFFPSAENVSYSLGNDTSRITLEKVDDFIVFTELDPKTCTILGHVHARGRAIPNFIKVSHGKGNLYLYTLPEVFSNYHMLQKDSYEYVSALLNVIQNRQIWLSDYFYESDVPKTPLRVILSNPGFVQAWYILLFALLMLLIFKTKREQRAVKVVLPEPNLSKEFAKTIAIVYYENGDPGNIIHKKIEYFLFAIRNVYHLETMDLIDDKFIDQLAAKSTVHREDTGELMRLLSSCKERQQFSIDDVKIINNKIEEFKRKANL